MLVLTRKLGEEIVIGDTVRVVVKRIAGARVALGINAPQSVTITRGELDGEPRSDHADNSESGFLAAS